MNNVCVKCDALLRTEGSHSSTVSISLVSRNPIEYSVQCIELNHVVSISLKMGTDEIVTLTASDEVVCVMCVSYITVFSKMRVMLR